MRATNEGIELWQIVLHVNGTLTMPAFGQAANLNDVESLQTTHCQLSHMLLHSFACNNLAHVLGVREVVYTNCG